MYEVFVTTQFSAAHRLKGYDANLKTCTATNGRQRLMLEARGLTPMVAGIDFAKLKEKVETCLSLLDYKNINEIPPFDKDNPSAENIARWLYKKLSSDLNGESVRIKKVEIYEMPNCGASYYE